MEINYRKELDKIPVYVPGKPIDDVKRELGLDYIVKLASNENPFGCSPMVKAAVLNAFENVNLYPDGNATELKKTIASKLGLTPDMVMPSCGSDEMVDLIAKTFINKGDEVLMADITFPRYFSTSQMMGADIKIIPLKDLTYDIDAFTEMVSDKTKIVWLCNPNNPTGTSFSKTKLDAFLAKVPDTTLVIYDEAYNEFADDPEYPKNILETMKVHKNVLVMRTLSKAYGLAGIRLGFTLGDPEILNMINRVRNPFNTTLLSQYAAMAGLKDDEFVKKTVANNKIGREYISSEFGKMGIKFAPTQANHIIFNAELDNKEVFDKLLRMGCIIRPIGGFDPNTWLRVSIGLPEENEYFIKCLKKVLNK